MQYLMDYTDPPSLTEFGPVDLEAVVRLLETAAGGYAEDDDSIEAFDARLDLVFASVAAQQAREGARVVACYRESEGWYFAVGEGGA